MNLAATRRKRHIIQQLNFIFSNMHTDSLFCSLSSFSIADLIRSARQAICYAGPGMQQNVAQAMLEASGRLGVEMLTVCLDFDERVMRMGYGEVEAIGLLRNAGIDVSDVAGLRTAFVIVDDVGFVFTPTALYLEAEPVGSAAPNAMRMSAEQRKEALARLSPG